MERLSRAVGVPTRAELGREPETDVKNTLQSGCGNAPVSIRSANYWQSLIVTETCASP